MLFVERNEFGLNALLGGTCPLVIDKAAELEQDGTTTKNAKEIICGLGAEDTTKLIPWLSQRNCLSPLR